MVIFIVWIAFILLQQKKNLKNKDFCNVIMLSKDNKILEFSQYQKSNKAPFIIYADLQSIIEKIDECKNNPENYSTAKVSKHVPSSFSLSTISLFRSMMYTEVKIVWKSFVSP